MTPVSKRLSDKAIVNLAVNHQNSRKKFLKTVSIFLLLKWPNSIREYFAFSKKKIMVITGYVYLNRPSPNL